MPFLKGSVYVCAGLSTLIEMWTLCEETMTNVHMQCLYKPQRMAMQRKLYWWIYLRNKKGGWCLYACGWCVGCIMWGEHGVRTRVENLKCLVDNMICTKSAVNTVFGGCSPPVSTHKLHRDSILLKNKASKMTSGFPCYVCFNEILASLHIFSNTQSFLKCQNLGS